MSLDPLSALLNVGKSVIERVWPDKTEQAKQLLKLKELEQRGDMAELAAHVQSLTGQLEINKIEASHKSIFISGWRPFIGWICGGGLAYASLIEPLMRFIATVCGYTGGFPQLDTTITMQILTGMLGLGALRTHEKTKGVHKNSLKKGK